MDNSLREKMRIAREAYSMSAAGMNHICGFGENMWALYESGKRVPSKSNERLIIICTEPFSFVHLLNSCPAIVAERIGIEKFHRCVISANEICQKINRMVEAQRGAYDRCYFGKPEQPKE